MASGTSGTTQIERDGRRVRRHRPPRQLTERLVKAICAEVARGVPQTAAAGSLGVPRRTLQNWLAAGRAEGAPEPYRSFADRLTEALDRFHASRAVIVGEAGEAHTALSVLERRFPDDWARVQRVDATIAARPFVDASKLSLEEQRQLYELLQKAAPAAEELPKDAAPALLALGAGEPPA